jgi:hypothetical protein
MDSGRRCNLQSNVLKVYASDGTGTSETLLTMGISDRGRDTYCYAPPAQNRTCGFPASGFHLGYLTIKPQVHGASYVTQRM